VFRRRAATRRSSRSTRRGAAREWARERSSPPLSAASSMSATRRRQGSTRGSPSPGTDEAPRTLLAATARPRFFFVYVGFSLPRARATPGEQRELPRSGNVVERVASVRRGPRCSRSTRRCEPLALPRPSDAEPGDALSVTAPSGKARLVTDHFRPLEAGIHRVRAEHGRPQVAFAAHCSTEDAGSPPARGQCPSRRTRSLSSGSRQGEEAEVARLALRPARARVRGSAGPSRAERREPRATLSWGAVDARALEAFLRGDKKVLASSRVRPSSDASSGGRSRATRSASRSRSAPLPSRSPT